MVSNSLIKILIDLTFKLINNISILNMIVGCRAGSVFLEQRVHHVLDQRQRFSHPANHVPSTIQEQQVPLVTPHVYS